LSHRNSNCNYQANIFRVSPLKVAGVALDTLAVEHFAIASRCPRHRQALVISDIQWLEMDGHTFTTRLRAGLRLEHLYVIMYTSMSRVFDRSKIAWAGANKFIARFDPDILARSVISVPQELPSNGRQYCLPRLPPCRSQSHAR